MTKDELASLIQASVPGRMTGNEENAILAERAARFVQTERGTLVELLRDWVSIRIPQSQRKPEDGMREGRIWLALEIMRNCGLVELYPAVDALIADVRLGKTFLPYYADMIAKYRNPSDQGMS